MIKKQIQTIQERSIFLDTVEETFYDPYGAILSGGSESRYDYEGKEFSEATDDYDFHFRKYNPEVGIFTQPEQIISNSQTASGGSSVWGGVKKEASNIWKGIKNILGRIF